MIFREPTARLLSAWFYRGHSPNLDFFQVRPYFKEISQGKLPRVTFEEYIEMPEYQNIMTRMLGADSFPYRNVTITDQVYQNAVETIDRFFFIGLQEEFKISTSILVRKMHADEQNISIVKERDQQNLKQIKQQKSQIMSNSSLMQRVREVNSYDLQLYQLAVKRFCDFASKYSDLMDKIRSNGKVKCT